MKIVKSVELTDDECLAIETTVLIVEKLSETVCQNESFDSIFCYLADAMDDDGKLENIIKF